MLYRKKDVFVEAHRWWKNGDHPQDRVGKQELDQEALYRLHPELWDEETGEVGPVPEDAPMYTRQEGALVRYYRHPLVPGGSSCGTCGALMHKHGWINTGDGTGSTVCPGDWIITDGDRSYPARPDAFKSRFEPVPDTEPDMLQDGVVVGPDGMDWNLEMPFVTVQSKGGPHDDSSYVQGWCMSMLDNLVAHLPAVSVRGILVQEQNRPQADLIALKYGFVASFEETGTDTWLYLHLAPGTPATEA